MRAFLLSSRGRLDRLGYLVALLVCGLVFCAPLGLIAPQPVSDALRAAMPSIYDALAQAVGAVCWIMVVWVYCATTARRLHDLGRSGWLAALALIPAVGLGALTVVLLSLPGAPRDNRYGARWI